MWIDGTWQPNGHRRMVTCMTHLLVQHEWNLHYRARFALSQGRQPKHVWPVNLLMAQPGKLWAQFLHWCWASLDSPQQYNDAIHDIASIADKELQLVTCLKLFLPWRESTKELRNYARIRTHVFLCTPPCPWSKTSFYIAYLKKWENWDWVFIFWKVNMRM